jgi:2,4-dienoyl-CoA reductase-like NADH-dependent reductase (Old Yellow Enzyme family)
MRLSLEVIRRIRAAVPEPPLGARISVTDWVEGGLAVEDGVAIAQAYRVAGVAYVCCSSSGYSPAQRVPTAPASRCTWRKRCALAREW